jgi:hypothetical protein
VSKALTALMCSATMGGSAAMALASLVISGDSLACRFRAAGVPGR